MYELKLFTVKDLRCWLYFNQQIEGLGESIISRQRANAIIHNPYVKDDDPVVSGVYESGEIVAYTAVFPDMICEKRIWWFTTLWCNPAFRGKGYGLLAVGALAEKYGDECIFDLWGAPETVAIFNYLGLASTMIPEYHLRDKKFNLDTIKGRFAYSLHKTILRFNSRERRWKKEISTIPYVLEYIGFIDTDTYAFILNHSENNLFQRSCEMLNWILQYPFIQECLIKERVRGKESFRDISYKYRLSGVKVLYENKLIGFYILRESDSGMDIKYLYYENRYEMIVFSSVFEHILNSKPKVFATRDKNLFSFIRAYDLFPITEVHHISISHPKSFVIADSAIIQGGDGDNFV